MCGGNASWRRKFIQFISIYPPYPALEKQALHFFQPMGGLGLTHIYYCCQFRGDQKVPGKKTPILILGTWEMTTIAKTILGLLPYKSASLFGDE